MMFGCVSLSFVVSGISKPIYNAVLILNNVSYETDLETPAHETLAVWTYKVLTVMGHCTITTLELAETRAKGCMLALEMQMSSHVVHFEMFSVFVCGGLELFSVLSLWMWSSGSFVMSLCHLHIVSPSQRVSHILTPPLVPPPSLAHLLGSHEKQGPLVNHGQPGGKWACPDARLP